LCPRRLATYPASNGSRGVQPGDVIRRLALILVLVVLLFYFCFIARGGEEDTTNRSFTFTISFIVGFSFFDIDIAGFVFGLPAESRSADVGGRALICLIHLTLALLQIGHGALLCGYNPRSHLPPNEEFHYGNGSFCFVLFVCCGCLFSILFFDVLLKMLMCLCVFFSSSVVDVCSGIRMGTR